MAYPLETRSTRSLLVHVISAICLIWHASRFDFVCDDAFIAFRYADNLVTHGQLTYNLGEAVEGHTSLLWVLLLALLHTTGLGLPKAALVLGVLGGAMLVVATSRLLQSLCRVGPLGEALALGGLVMSAPVAAWTLGGLETPLFATLVVASLTETSTFVQDPSPKRAGWLALTLVMAVLTRPEGLILVGLSCLIAIGRSWRRGWQLLAGICLFVAVYEWWRWASYQSLVPNSFTVKTSGDVGARIARGLEYLAFFAREMGWPWVATGALALVVPPRATENSARILTWMVRALVLIWLPYLVWIGGDFLDLYRFLVPLIPLVWALIVARASEYWLMVRDNRARWVAAGLAWSLVFAYGFEQAQLGSRALRASAPERAELGIEPLGWTREYALRWAAMGRWLRVHASPSDWLAVGAAGAMPFYSGLNNLDTFGLCDAYVARHGTLLGVRPGHQRFAPFSYLVQRRPVFLLVGDFSSPSRRTLPIHSRYHAYGYVWAEAEVTPARHGAPSRFYHYFLLRRDRAASLLGSPDFRTTLGGGVNPSGQSAAGS